MLTATHPNLSLVCLQRSCPAAPPVQGQIWWGCKNPRQEFRLHLLSSFAGTAFVISYMTSVDSPVELPLHRALTQITHLKGQVILSLIHLGQDSKDFKPIVDVIWQVLWVTGIYHHHSSGASAFPAVLPLAALNQLKSYHYLALQLRGKWALELLGTTLFQSYLTEMR